MLPTAISSAPELTGAKTIRSPSANTRWPERTGSLMIIVGSGAASVSGAFTGAGGTPSAVGAATSRPPWSGAIFAAEGGGILVETAVLDADHG